MQLLVIPVFTEDMGEVTVAIPQHKIRYIQTKGLKACYVFVDGDASDTAFLCTLPLMSVVEILLEKAGKIG